MEDERDLEIGDPVHVQDVVIHPIAERRILAASPQPPGETEAPSQSRGADEQAEPPQARGPPAMAIGRLRPLGIVVEGPQGRRSLDLDGRPLADDLIEQLPSIDEE